MPSDRGILAASPARRRVFAGPAASPSQLTRLRGSVELTEVADLITGRMSRSRATGNLNAAHTLRLRSESGPAAGTGTSSG
jgi:hypothetical protein